MQRVALLGPPSVRPKRQPRAGCYPPRVHTRAQTARSSEVGNSKVIATLTSQGWEGFNKQISEFSNIYFHFSCVVVNTVAGTNKRSPIKRQKDRPSLRRSQASVLLVLIPSLDKWDGWVRKGIQYKSCAKSNMQIHLLLLPLGN